MLSNFLTVNRSLLSLSFCLSVNLEYYFRPDRKNISCCSRQHGKKSILSPCVPVAVPYEEKPLYLLIIDVRDYARSSLPSKEQSTCRKGGNIFAFALPLPYL